MLRTNNGCPLVSVYLQEDPKWRRKGTKYDKEGKKHSGQLQSFLPHACTAFDVLVFDGLVLR